MPLIPLLLAAKQAHDLLQLAHKALEHYRGLPRDEQLRLRHEAELVGTLVAELTAATRESVRGHAAGPREPASGRDAKVVAAELYDALARLTDSAAREAAVITETESLTAHYAAKAVSFGARRMNRSRGTAVGAGQPMWLGSSV